jgi:hypothetical protein
MKLGRVLAAGSGLGGAQMKHTASRQRFVETLHYCGVGERSALQVGSGHGVPKLPEWEIYTIPWCTKASGPIPYNMLSN